MDLLIESGLIYLFIYNNLQKGVVMAPIIGLIFYYR